MTEYETAALAISQAQVWVALGQVAISGIGLGAILWGLAQMQRAGRRRDREVDVMAETLRESTRQQAETSAQIGQALERQSQALAELLHRSAPSP